MLERAADPHRSARARARQRQDKDIGFAFWAMVSDCEIRIAGLPRRLAEPLAHLAIAEVRRIESKYSRYRPASVVSRINASAGLGRAVEVDDETARLLDFAARLHAFSAGLFDITSGALRKAWDFRARRMPAMANSRRCCPWSVGAKSFGTVAGSSCRCGAWNWTLGASGRNMRPIAPRRCSSRRVRGMEWSISVAIFV